jgi:LCP family protein required for cell wall assembly
MKNFAKKALKVILSITLLCLIAAGAYIYTNLNQIKKKTLSDNNADLGITKIVQSSAKKEDDNKIVNIALFGIDTGRAKYEAAHSDAIMILTIDKLHKKIKLSSIMRDAYVNIDGHEMNKINTAYAFGGPELAVRTINENFDTDIKDYVTVDFAGLSNMIDAVHGVDINVKQYEIKEVNKYAKEVAQIKKEKFIPVKKSGMQTLDGNQAVAYARIRKVGNGDFERTERQKEVLTALLYKIQKQNPAKYPFIVSKFLPYVETSMTNGDILKTGLDAYGLGLSKIYWMRFPEDGYYKGKIINKIWYLTFDLKETKDHMHNFIYEDAVNAAKTTN